MTTEEDKIAEEIWKMARNIESFVNNSWLCTTPSGGRIISKMANKILRLVTTLQEEEKKS